ncbi:MAG TPA: hypothetical protein VMW49_09650, partial [Candidatus Dormibacteraeota bacterium]|nr:hypothetical protein [Candidatus Dormibacteraeota bacterium]
MVNARGLGLEATALVAAVDPPPPARLFREAVHGAIVRCVGAVSLLQVTVERGGTAMVVLAAAPGEAPRLGDAAVPQSLEVELVALLQDEAGPERGVSVVSLGPPMATATRLQGLLEVAMDSGPGPSPPARQRPPAPGGDRPPAGVGRDPH